MSNLLYFHSDAPTAAPTAGTKASNLPKALNNNAVTGDFSLRSTATGLGTTGVTMSVGSQATISQQSHYFGRYSTPALDAQTIAAQQWTIGAFVGEGNAAANTYFWPVMYVWRPSTSAVVGYIFNANADGGAEWYASAGANESDQKFAGAEVTCQRGDILVFEAWAAATQAMATSYTQTWRRSSSSSRLVATNELAYYTAPSPIGGLTDDFDSTTLSTSKWTNVQTGTGTNSAGGVLAQKLTGTASAEAGIVSASLWDARNASAYVKVVQALRAPSGTAHEQRFSLRGANDSTLNVAFSLDPVTGALTTSYNNANSVQVAASNGATNHPWLRIRHDGTNWLWQTAGPSASNPPTEAQWTTHRTVAAATVGLDAQHVRVRATCIQTSPSVEATASGIWDGLNTAANADVSAVTDTFDSLVTGTQWKEANSSGSGNGTSGARLWQTPGGSAYAYAELQTFPARSIQGNHAFVRLVAPATKNGSTQWASTSMSLLPYSEAGSATNQLHFKVQNGELSGTANSASAPVAGEYRVPYDLLAHAWLRLREQGGTYYWETAPATASNPPIESDWVVRRTLAVSAIPAMLPQSVVVCLTACEEEGTTSPSGIKSAYWDGFNAADNGRMSDFTENFDAALNTMTKWGVERDTSSTSTTVGGRLEENPVVWNGWAYTYTKKTFSLLESHVYVRLVSPALMDGAHAGDTGFWSAGMAHEVDQSGNYRCRYWENNADIEPIHSETYDPAAHAWFRSRESGGTYYWETAPITASNPPIESDWVVRRTLARSATTTGDVNRASVSLDVDGMVSGTGTYTPAKWDGLNTAANTVRPKVEGRKFDFSQPLDLNAWTVWKNATNTVGSLSVESGRLKLTNGPDTATNSDYISVAAWVGDTGDELSLEGSAIFVRVSDVPSGGRISFGFETADIPSYGAVEFSVSGSSPRSLVPYVEYSAGAPGAEFPAVSPDYDPVQHAWWRIRQTGASIYFETAPETASNPPIEADWTEVWSRPYARLNLASGDIYLSCRNTSTSVAPAVYFDGLNTGTESAITGVAHTGSISENGSVIETITVFFVHGGTATESSPANDALSAVLSAISSRTETTSAGETLTAANATSSSRTETTTATESSSVGLLLVDSGSESASAADSSTSVKSTSASSTESSPASDGATALTSSTASRTEANTLAETRTVSAALSSTQAESSTLAETRTVSLAGAATGSESSTLAETRTATASLGASRTETNTAAESTTTLASLGASRTETGTAAETPSASGLLQGQLTESAPASESADLAGSASEAALSESAALAEAQTSVASMGSSRAESGSLVETSTGSSNNESVVNESAPALESPSVSAALAASRGETATAGESATGGVSTAASRTESGALAESQTSTASLTGSRTETNTLAETRTVSAALAASRAEANTLAETRTAAAALAASRGETTTASESTTTLASLGATQAESTTASDSSTGALATSATGSETATLADSPLALSANTFVVSEAGSLSEAGTAAASQAANRAESQTLVESPSGTVSIQVTRSEVGTLAEVPTVLAQLLATRAEAATASELITVSVVLSVARSEAGGLAEAVDAAMTGIQASVAEAASITDLRSAVTSALAAAVEVAGLSEDRTGTITLSVNMAEAGAAGDNPAATLTVQATLAEAMTAQDSSTGAVMTTLQASFRMLMLF